MRRLLYVPIIHGGPDMGRVGAALAQKTATISGPERWEAHQETMRQFWDGVEVFLRSLDPGQLKLYQDGLAIGGKVGRQIVEETAGQGSRNHQLVLGLLNSGAELRKTEDPVLLLQEHQNLLGLLQQDSAGERRWGSEMYRSQRDRLTEQRDKFIAQTINTTLKEPEIGVLFIGAYHHVASYVAEEVSVEEIKDATKVKAYFEELVLGHDAKKLEELREYLISPIRVP